MIQLKNIGKDYKIGRDSIRALRCVNLTLPERGLVLFTGPSGSGKSTLRRILSGEERNYRGELRLQGENASRFTADRMAAARRGTANAGDPLPLRNASLFENFTFAARASGWERDAAEKKADAALELFGIQPLAGSYPSEMSGEEQRLALLACAFARDCACLLCDEPTDGLSLTNAASVLSALTAAARERLVVVFSRDEQLFSENTARVIHLSEGQVTSDTCSEVPQETSRAVLLRRSGRGLGGMLFRRGLSRAKGAAVRTLAAFLAVLLAAMFTAGVNGAIQSSRSVQSETLSVYPITLTQSSVPSGNLSSLAEWFTGRVQGTEVSLSYGVDLWIYSSDTSSGVKRITPNEDGVPLWTELNGSADTLSSRYELAAGRYPSAYNEAVVLLDSNGTIDAACLRALGLDTEDTAYTYNDFLRMSFRLIVPTQEYVLSADGTWTWLGDDSGFMRTLASKSTSVNIVGVLKPGTEEARNTASGSVGYLSALKDYALQTITNSDIVTAQLNDPMTDVTCGKPFDTADVLSAEGECRTELLLAYVDSLGTLETKVLCNTLTGESVTEEEASGKLHNYINSLTDEETQTLFETYVASQVSGSTLEQNLTDFGYASAETVTAMYIFADSFATRNSAAALLRSYPETVTYTDTAAAVSAAGEKLASAQTQLLPILCAGAYVLAAAFLFFTVFLAVRMRREERDALEKYGISTGTFRGAVTAECLIYALAGSLLGALAALLLVQLCGGILPGEWSLSITEAALPAAGGTLLSGLAGYAALSGKKE